MTLEYLENVKTQLQTQLTAVVQQQTPEKPVIQHCNAIEILAAIQLISQLIIAEHVTLTAPPGATGPTL